MYEQMLKFPVDETYIEGRLTLPVRASSLVIFAQGSGPFSEEYLTLAEFLQREGVGTLLFNPAYEREERGRRLDIEAKARRLVAVTLWISSNADYRALDLAYLGGGSGAAVAFKAASRLKSIIRAVISCGGKIELATDEIKGVICPTLLVVGELDFHIRALNTRAMKLLCGRHEMAVIPGASHLFEEPGKLDMVANDVISWLHKYVRVGEPVSEEEFVSSKLESYEENQSINT